MYEADGTIGALSSEWGFLMKRLCPSMPEGRAERIFRNVVVREYTASWRAYHTLDHVAYCLSELHGSPEATDRDAVMYAIFLHDLVYETRLRSPCLASSEERSAEHADSILRGSGAGAKVRMAVRGLILATRHIPGSAKTPDEQLIADIDLSPIGWQRESFDADGKKIRHEYSIYSDTVFFNGRKKWVESMLARSQLFHHERFRDRFERQARDNLAREHARISSLLA